MRGFLNRVSCANNPVFIPDFKAGANHKPVLNLLANQIENQPVNCYWKIGNKRNDALQEVNR